MMRLAVRGLLALALLITSFACASDTATSPLVEETSFDPAELSLDAMDRGDPLPSVDDRSVPTLQRVLHEAVAKVRAERGDAAARRLLEPLHSLLSEARAAREAGDVTAARRALHEANLTAARIIVSVFGPRVTERLNAAVTDGLAALRRRIGEIEAGGGDATRLTQAAKAVASLQDAASRLVLVGAYPRAVVLLSHALDVLRLAAAGA
jgi:hypothetical protein